MIAQHQKLLIADSNPICRIMLKQILQPFTKIEVVAESESGETTCDLIENLRPDLLLLDIDIFGLDCFSVIEKTKKLHPNLIIIIVANEHEEKGLNLALKLGVNAFLLRNTISDCLKQCLTAVNMKQTFVSTHLCAS